MYDIHVANAGFLYVREFKKIYARVSLEIIYSYWEYAAIVPDDIHVDPTAGNVSKDINVKIRAISPPATEGTAWRTHFLAELHDEFDGVPDNWSSADEVKTFIDDKSYNVFVDVYKGTAKQASGSGTINRDSDIDIE